MAKGTSRHRARVCASSVFPVDKRRGITTEARVYFRAATATIVLVVYEYINYFFQLITIIFFSLTSYFGLLFYPNLLKSLHLCFSVVL